MENPTLLLEELTLFFNRTIVEDPEGLDMRYSKFWLGVKSPDNARDLMKENRVAYVAKRITKMIKGLNNRSVLEVAKERLPYNDSKPNTRQVRSIGTNRFGMYGGSQAK
ncbi:hypothetical protein SADUNF_Sadunf04G0068500 [Salix dunnii]|uniref:Uncharacterized protein n=1 Tax=Salix dunnii TaxID=1413687 RepID=A0A835MYW2_9ROSI|nr:hypothetical protein SADUNF_Sadunf04G0068500 [Salix dunnii]